MSLVLEDNTLFNKVPQEYHYNFPKAELLGEGQRFEGSLSVEWSWPKRLAGTFEAEESQWPSHWNFGSGKAGTLAKPWTVKAIGGAAESFGVSARTKGA